MDDGINRVFKATQLVQVQPMSGWAVRNGWVYLIFSGKQTDMQNSGAYEGYYWFRCKVNDLQRAMRLDPKRYVWIATKPRIHWWVRLEERDYES